MSFTIDSAKARLSGYRLTALSCCAIGLGLSACTTTAPSDQGTSGRFQGEQARVELIVKKLVVAQSNKSDGTDVIGDLCKGMLAKDLVSKLEKRYGSCQTGIEKAVDIADRPGAALKEIKIDGDKATATVELSFGKDKKRTETWNFIRESKHWVFTGSTRDKTTSK